MNLSSRVFKAVLSVTVSALDRLRKAPGVICAVRYAGLSGDEAARGLGGNHGHIICLKGGGKRTQYARLRAMNRFLCFPKSQLISPTNPTLRIEPAIDCDGSECGIAFPDEDGSLPDLPPHYHMVESQPGAWTRLYPLGGHLPESHYESSHY
jgi:hypothetical protein